MANRVIRACTTGDVAELQRLLDAGLLDVHTRHYGGPPLRAAASCNQVAVFDFLLSCGATVDERDGADTTPLFAAAERGHEAAVRALLQRGADPDATDRHRKTALVHAVMSEKVNVIRALLEGRASANVVDEDEMTPLGYACIEGNLDIVRLLVEVGHAAVDDVGHTGFPLRLATSAVSSSVPCMRYLLQRGALLDGPDLHGGTALIDAAMSGSNEGALLLLFLGASTTRRDEDGLSATVCAAHFGRVRILEGLLERQVAAGTVWKCSTRRGDSGLIVDENARVDQQTVVERLMQAEDTAMARFCFV